MAKHFSTVPVDGALQAARHSSSGLPPVALVVDDDPMITGTLAAILGSSGLAALTAADGIEAREVALLIPPEILIADLVIPGMTGLELALQVTHASPDCEVILFDGYPASFDLSSKLRGLERDFTVLIKPVHPADLLDAVFKLLSRRGHPVESPTRFRSPTPLDFVSAWPSRTVPQTAA